MSDNLIEIVILRHGEAGTASSDRERPLTDYGREQVSSQYQWLLDQGFLPELILHSPYRRTSETAILAADFFHDAKIKIEPLLKPDADPAIISSLIPTLGNSRILLVSHMPLVSYLTAAISEGIQPFAFPVAGLCWLNLNRETLSAKLFHKKWPDL